MDRSINWQEAINEYKTAVAGITENIMPEQQKAKRPKLESYNSKRYIYIYCNYEKIREVMKKLFCVEWNDAFEDIHYFYVKRGFSDKITFCNNNTEVYIEAAHALPLKFLDCLISDKTDGLRDCCQAFIYSKITDPFFKSELKKYNPEYCEENIHILKDKILNVGLYHNLDYLEKAVEITAVKKNNAVFDVGSSSGICSLSILEILDHDISLTAQELTDKCKQTMIWYYKERTKNILGIFMSRNKIDNLIYSVIFSYYNHENISIIENSYSKKLRKSIDKIKQINISKKHSDVHIESMEEEAICKADCFIDGLAENLIKKMEEI